MIIRSIFVASFITVGLTGLTMSESAKASDRSQAINEFPAFRSMAEANSDFLVKLNKSLAVWSRMKKAALGRYDYTIRQSSWAGFGAETAFAVAGDIIVARKYRSWNRDQQVTVKWEERAPVEIGTNSEGAPLKTMETLYAECKQLLSTKNSRNHNLGLDLDKNGILKSCFYSRKMCADDCSSGVLIGQVHFRSFN